MSGIQLEFLRTWIGKETTSEDVLSLRHARLMGATLGLPQDALVEGAELPPLWHWLYFLEGLPAAELGPDGHPARGGFLPPVPLPNRMWAGGRLEFHAPLVLGRSVRKRSAVRSIEPKRGRSGELVFVTVRHQIFAGDRIAITEDQDIVYKERTAPGAASAAPAAGPQARHSERFEATSTMLFRYSALTFNGHRIHYDQDYCRHVEGYANLVIHGPLQATLLAGMAARLGSGPLRRFHYRGLRPSVLGMSLTVNAAPSADGLSLWIAQPDGSLSMQAEARF